MCSMAQVFRPGSATRWFAMPGLVFSGLVLMAVSACSGVGVTDSDTSEISVEVHQTRSNVAARQLTIGVTNGSSQPIEVTSARFLSEQFVSAAVWPKDTTTIGAGVTADLPVPLPAADCDAESPSPIVELEYRPVSEGAEAEPSGAERSRAEPSGSEPSGSAEPTAIRSVTVTPVDSLDQLEPLFVADCLVDAAEQVATITANTAPRVSTVHDHTGAANTVAELDLTVTPTGGPGILTIVSARSTTLFSQVDPVTNLPSEIREVDVAVSAASGPQTITLQLLPSRCDPHAVAEDKLGTVFPVEISLDGEGDPSEADPSEADPSGTSSTGTMSVAASTEVRAQLYDFVTRTCAAQ
jgi:hypothetical protein